MAMHCTGQNSGKSTRSCRPKEFWPCVCSRLCCELQVQHTAQKLLAIALFNSCDDTATATRPRTAVCSSTCCAAILQVRLNSSRTADCAIGVCLTFVFLCDSAVAPEVLHLFAVSQCICRVVLITSADTLGLSKFRFWSIHDFSASTAPTGSLKAEYKYLCVVWLACLFFVKPACRSNTSVFESQAAFEFECPAQGRVSTEFCFTTHIMTQSIARAQ